MSSVFFPSSFLLSFERSKRERELRESERARARASAPTTLNVAWRIAEAPLSHLHSILKDLYFPDSSIWLTSSSVPKSGFWSSLLKVMQFWSSQLKIHCFYELTQGNMSVWSTPWCSSWSEVYNHLIIRHPSLFILPW